MTYKKEKKLSKGGYTNPGSEHPVPDDSDIQNDRENNPTTVDPIVPESTGTTAQEGTEGAENEKMPAEKKEGAEEETEGVVKEGGKKSKRKTAKKGRKSKKNKSKKGGKKTKKNNSKKAKKANKSKKSKK